MGHLNYFEEIYTYSERLLKKLHWDYRDSYNPIARLSAQMEASILDTKSAIGHHSTSQSYSNVTSYNYGRVVDDLYNYENVNLRDYSNEHWLPLSQWLNDENQLKTICIGLLKLVDSTKTEAAGNDTDDIKRFEGLLDFLHYIPNKRIFQPFYLQMLNTALKAPTISLRSITFPRFISYENIEEVSVLNDRINFESNLTSHQQEKIMTEIKQCFSNECSFEDDNDLLTRSEIRNINKLLRECPRDYRVSC